MQEKFAFNAKQRYLFYSLINNNQLSGKLER